MVALCCGSSLRIDFCSDMVTTSDLAFNYSNVMSPREVFSDWYPNELINFSYTVGTANPPGVGDLASGLDVERCSR
jgi:hypothetical protein